jgi:hypothetical protein
VSKMRGDTNERPVWRSVIHETIAAEAGYFTDAAGVVDKVLLRESVDDSLRRSGGDVDRLFTADARRSAIREEINRHFSASRAQYAVRDRESREVSRRAAFYRQAVQIPLGGNTFVLKPRIACTLADSRLMANYWAKRQRHAEREGRWWGAVVARMERHGCAEDAPITAVVRLNDEMAA